MVCRVWHGWTAPAVADSFEHHLRVELLPGIRARGVLGFLGAQVLRRNEGPETEFVTLMWFSTWEAIQAFAGEDIGAAVVLPETRAFLTRCDERVVHYEGIGDTIG